MNDSTAKRIPTRTVVRYVAWSKGLAFIAIVAPLLWGLLPLGYTHVKQDALVEANPTFIVLMRMFFSCVVSIVLLKGYLTYKAASDKNRSDIPRDAYSRMFWATVRSAFTWRKGIFLALLGIFYFGARYVEMKCILGFSFQKEEVLEGQKVKKADASYCSDVGSTCAQHPYLCEGRKISEQESNQKASGAVETSQQALREFGYFMGLLLALLMMVKNRAVYGLIERLWRKRAHADMDLIKSLKGDPLTFVGGISLGITAFLIIASGILNLAAREPLFAWPGVWKMLAIAALVAVLTSFGSDCKKGSKLKLSELELKSLLGIEESDKTVPRDYSNTSSLVSCVVVNMFMAGMTTVIAMIVWCFDKNGPSGCSFCGLVRMLFKAFFADYRWLTFGILVVLLGSVIAPVVQLLGVLRHDEEMAGRGLSKYGIGGDDWLQICGGMEPLFVVLIGIALAWVTPCVVSWLPLIGKVQGTAHPFISYWPIILSVFTVLVIAALKIMEMWAVKNSVLRNFVYTKTRGSSRSLKDRNVGSDEIDPRSRAFELAMLKLFDKRTELKDCELELKRVDVGNWASFIPDGTRVENCAFAAVIRGGNLYFTQDDPFTHDIIGAQIDWLKSTCSNENSRVEIDSFSYRYKGLCKDSKPWRTNGEGSVIGLKDKVCEGVEDGTPFVVEVSGSDGEAVLNDVFAKWNCLLNEIRKAVRDGQVEAWVNGIMMKVLTETKSKKQ